MAPGKSKIAILLAGAPKDAPASEGDDSEMSDEDREDGKADAVGAVSQALGIEQAKAQALLEAVHSYCQIAGDH